MLVRIKGLRCARVQSFFICSHIQLQIFYHIKPIMQDNFSVSPCTTFYTFFFVQPFQNLASCTTKPQLIFAAIRGSSSNWLYEIRTTSALLDKGAVLKRNDCVNIYAFRLVRVWGWSWRSGIIRFHDTLSLCPHTREHCFTFYRPYIRDSRI